MEETYKNLCEKKSDINEHLPTLYKYATECKSVFETGVRGVVSSWAFAWGLKNNDDDTKKLFMNDLSVCETSNVEKACSDNGITVKTEWKNNLELTFEENETYDLTFIDTYHVYGQLKRELEKFSKITNKFIIMHDTQVDAIQGEHLRCMWDGTWDNLKRASAETGIPTNELMVGLLPAVDQFLDNNKEWELHEMYQNNNGLTVLRRKV
jgi:hypothetical protein